MQRQQEVKARYCMCELVRATTAGAGAGAGVEQAVGLFEKVMMKICGVENDHMLQLGISEQNSRTSCNTLPRLVCHLGPFLLLFLQVPKVLETFSPAYLGLMCSAP